MRSVNPVLLFLHPLQRSKIIRFSDLFRMYRNVIPERNGSKTEVVVQRCSVKKVFLEISQNAQENTCAKVSFLIKLQA